MSSIMGSGLPGFTMEQSVRGTLQDMEEDIEYRKWLVDSIRLVHLCWPRDVGVLSLWFDEEELIFYPSHPTYLHDTEVVIRPLYGDYSQDYRYKFKIIVSDRKNGADYGDQEFSLANGGSKDIARVRDEIISFLLMADSIARRAQGR